MGALIQFWPWLCVSASIIFESFGGKTAGTGLNTPAISHSELGIYPPLMRLILDAWGTPDSSVGP